MESNKSFEVNDNEVPLKTDPIQSDNGVETIEEVKSALNSVIESIDGQNITSSECDTKDESEKNNEDSKENTSDDTSRHQYSKEQLIQISKLSSARVRPKCLDNAFNNANNGLWNPEKWISSRSPAANSSNKYTKKVNDLKDRVIEEENEIILSPQRGSFGTGCHVSSNSFGSNRASNDSRNRDHYNERNKMEESNDGSHRSNNNSRRVGSGRIVAKERDRPNEWVDRSYDRSYDYRNDDFNERRSGRYERRPNRDVNSNRNVRYESQRYKDRYSRDEEENEPEWFTEGPTSKHDTIELKGFDDDVNSSHNKDMSEDKSKDFRNNKNFESNVENKTICESNGKEVKHLEKEVKSEDFDVNAMFKSEEWFGKEYETPENKMISSSVGISDNVNNESDTNVKSRFKRWFKESPNQAMSSSVTSHLTDETSLKNRHKESSDIHSVNISSNTQSSNPISPEKIFELLSNGSNRLSIEQLSQHKFDPRKAMSLSQIEANFSKMDVNNSEGIDDKRAFNKLIFDLNKKSAQNSNSTERIQIENEVKSETTLIQTPERHIVLPKSMRNAPSILELLKEQENKEAMADLHRNNRRDVPNQSTNHPNGSNTMAQNSVNNLMFGTHSMSNVGPNPMEIANWQTKMVRPSRTPTNQEMSEHTSIILQKAIQTRQSMGQIVRPQTQSDIIRGNTPNRNVSNFLIPTSVMRNMHSEKDKDSVKTVMPFNDMSPESNSSQYKFVNENMISKPSPMRPIVKSNNPIGQSVASKQSPLSPHNSDSMTFGINTMAALQSHLYLPQQTVQQNQPPVNSYQRSISSPNPSVRPFNQSSLTRNSTPSPNSINNISMNSNPHILQMFNNPNVRTNINQMQMNQMMALQQNSASDGRQSQYPQSRPITANNVHQMLFNNSKSDQFNTFDRNMMSDSEMMKTSVPSTYSQPRPQMQQLFQNLGPSQPNRNTEPRFFGQIFGEDLLHHSLPELPTVPLHSALTLDDIERS